MALNVGELVGSIRLDGSEVYLSQLSKVDSAQKQTQKSIDNTAKSASKQADAAKGAGQAQAKQATEADKLTQRLRAQKTVLDGLGKSLLIFGGAAAAGVVIAVKAWSDYDAKLAQVRSLSKAGAADMQALSAQTMQYASQFGISASEAADAEIELVKGGVSVKDMINGGLTGALTLAAAGQLDVGDATSIAVSAMTQFGLKGQDVSHVADLLSAGADKALGSVQDLGEGLKYVGPVSSALGVSIEQTVGTLAELAQNGILGEQAGTSLRGMLSSLTSPSALAAKTMKQLGINVYDAQGNFVGLDGVAQQLQVHTKNLTEAQKNQALGQIFGNQQITAAQVLLKGGASAVDQWTKAVDQSGFAAEQAAGKLDSLQGDAQKLKAAFQNGLITTGSGANQVLRGMTQDATALLEVLGGMPPGLQKAALLIGGVTAASALLAGGLVAVVPKVNEFAGALETISGGSGALSRMAGGIKGVLALITNPWTLAIGGAAAILGGVFLKSELDAKKRVDDLRQSLDQQTGAITDNTRASAAKALQDDGAFKTANKLGLSLKTVTDAATGNATALAEVTKAVNDYYAANDNGGTAGRAAPVQDVKNFADAIGVQAKATKEAQKQQRDLIAAEADGADASSSAASAASGAASAVDQVQQAADDASQSVDDLAQALQGLDNGSLDASEAAVQFNQAVADATKTVSDHAEAAKNDKAAAADLANAVNASHDAFNLSTSAGRDNQSALDGIASSALSLLGAQEKAGASTDTLTKATQTARDNFIQAATRMGLSGDAAKKLADKYGLIPASVNTTITASNQQALNAISGVQAALAALGDKEIKLGGSAAGYYGFANGGMVDFFAQGGFRESHVAQIAPAGAWRVWAEPETGGEAYIPLAPSKRDRSTQIWRETGKRLGIEHYASGGIRDSLMWQFMSGDTSASSLINSLQQASTDDIFIKQAQRDLANEAKRDTKTLAALNKSLDTAQTALDKASAAASSAGDNLTSLKDSADQLKSSVASSLTSGIGSGLAGSINIGGWGSTVMSGAKSILSYLSGNASKLKAFANLLAQLQKKGVPGSLIQQIEDLGPDDGAAVAQTLLSASTADLKSIESAYSSVNSYAAQAGQIVSDSVYSQQISIAQKQYNQAVAAEAAAQKRVDSVNASITALGTRIQQVLTRYYGVPHADGGIVQKFADGGIPRVPQIVKGGANILWGEPETGWEAYISGKPAQRSRNLQILDEAARRLGVVVVNPRATRAFADGGIGGGGASSPSKIADVNLNIINPVVRDLMADTRQAANFVRSNLNV